MSKRLEIAVIGGDARYLELIKKLTYSEKYTIHLIGYDQLDPGYFSVNYTDLSAINPEELAAVILPITGVSENGEINPVFSNQLITFPEDWFSQLADACFVFTGITTPFLDDQVKQHAIRLVALMDRDDVAIYNAIPTAEGTVMLAIQHMNITIHEAQVVILGLGRVGLIVADRFAKLGAKVAVGVRKTRDIAKANALGFIGFHLGDLLAYTEKCDLLINTIPVLVVNKSHLNTLKTDATIIDLASKPGGVDFDYAAKRGLNTIHALGLPAKVAPKTAGEILANVIDQLIAEH
ncbi:dipicolinate synthase subunit A [Amphibacillus marinus]|uniref:Dipicolinate synthase subunit A n=1 Tax=Amphibacillus marinus TaxID=872970 RepID=A0A1H8NQK1_9BACI|nr:dipicolinate synthase subunit DpsA [Amphibacillus marinus]SEO31877.1 dipicolinate synthase subunit A [Amphibacillus marinus]